MDTATVLTDRHHEGRSTIETIASSDARKTLEATATYLLSEDGRKASLLAGGDGRAHQELTLEVPVHRLHLISVDSNGVARLKLRPQFMLANDKQIVRTDPLPTYNAPPSIDELYRDAARNHQLERAFDSERQATRDKRHEADRERSAALATAFLTDPTQRAVVHPAPAPTRCQLNTPSGRVTFDSRTDVG